MPSRVDWSLPSLLAVFWGIGGVVALLGQAIWRLTPLAVEPISEGMLTRAHVATYIGWVAFNLYAEGYRAFHRGFSPRVVARALYLAQEPRPWHVVFAPAFCMSLFCATRRGLVLAWGVLVTVVLLVLLMHWVPQPWRGIVDGGVVTGLLCGSGSLLWFAARALAGHAPAVATNLPATPGVAAAEPV